MADFLNISQALLKKLAKLADAKARQEEGIFLAEGAKVVEELLSSDWRIEALLIMPEKVKYWEKLSLDTGKEFPVYQLTRSQWQKIGQDREPEGIMAVVGLKMAPDFSCWLNETSGNILILHEINIPQPWSARAQCAMVWLYRNNFRR